MYIHIYCILLIICVEKLSLFHIFIFIPEQTFTVNSYHSIHVQKLVKKIHGCKVISKNVNFSLQMIRNIWYTYTYLHMYICRMLLE